MGTFRTDLLTEAAKVWAPDYPRRVSSDDSFQVGANNIVQTLRNLKRAAEAGQPGFVSTYSFPNGHSRSGNLPKIDTIFVDFDIQGERYRPEEGRARETDWEIEMSDLLVRVRRLAEALVGKDQAKYWRASLSGHKGIHLFLDFPPLDPDIATFGEFKKGLNEYADVMVESLDEAAGGIGIEEWVDVNSADLGRLVRMPNTPHHGVEYTDRTRYCVPVTIEELAEIDVERYKRLTSNPRSLSCERVPSETAGEKVRQTILDTETRSTSSLSTPSSYNTSRVKEYKENSDNRVTMEVLKFMTRDKPFMWEWRERDDAFRHGQQSRVMELFVMLECMHHNTPIDVIVDFLRPIPGFREDYTRELVKDLISRDYNRMSLRKVRQEAPEFYGKNRYEND
jgi:hypothetical protein